MLYELREYHVKTGCIDRWVDLMENLAIPFQRKMGMDVVATFVAIDVADLYIWIRRFENEEERLRLYDRVYGSRYWAETVRPAMGDMLLREKKRETLMRPIDTSELT